MRDSVRVLPLMLLLLLLSGCSSTWVDDSANFKRVFGFSQPSDVKVLHSYYWGAGYRVFRDKTDGTLFLCDQRRIREGQNRSLLRSGRGATRHPWEGCCGVTEVSER